FFSCLGDRPPPRPFPTRRSSDLGGRLVRVLLAAACVAAAGCSASPPAGPGPARPVGETAPASRLTAFESEAELLSFVRNRARAPDRKSTRLNSSHVAISYAVFCL